MNAFSGGIDGLWASRMKDVAIVAGPASYRLAAKTFRDAAGQDLGDMAFSDYAMEKYGGFWTNRRMPAAAANIQAAILYRMGMGETENSPMRTAVCPHWNEISIDDIYSGSARGERFFTMHVLLGDVILVQPDAYSAGCLPGGGGRLSPILKAQGRQGGAQPPSRPSWEGAR